MSKSTTTTPPSLNRWLHPVTGEPRLYVNHELVGRRRRIEKLWLQASKNDDTEIEIFCVEAGSFRRADYREASIVKDAFEAHGFDLNKGPGAAWSKLALLEA